ncbi:MAG: cell division protein ZapA [Deltaproteobacteria bacterium]|nr:cell division protein ZapA [Deltaproteobacteria bacterium]
MALEVEIFGQRYAVRSEAGEEHVRQVAEVVDAKMREVATSHPAGSALQVAVLAALHLASEVVTAEAETRRLAAEVDARAEALASRVAAVSPAACSS